MPTLDFKVGNSLSMPIITAIAAGEINLKDGFNNSMTLTMLMEDDFREKYNKVKAKKAVA